MTANCETCKHLKGIACTHPELDTMPYEKGCSYWDAVEEKGKDGVMGVCIHGLMEIKVAGSWHGIHREWGRNYNLFALMAGMRNENNLTPVSQPKGLPDDVSVLTRIENNEWGDDALSESWLSLMEVEIVARRIEILDGKPCRDIEGVKYHLRRYLQNHESVVETRLVFWFSN